MKSAATISRLYGGCWSLMIPCFGIPHEPLGANPVVLVLDVVVVHVHPHQSILDLKKQVEVSRCQIQAVRQVLGLLDPLFWQSS